MSDLISREALLKRMNRRLDILRKEFGLFDHYTDGYDEAIDHVMDFPAVEYEPVRHGRWIKAHGMMLPKYSGRHVCSECDRIAPSNVMGRETLTDYCPNCGAKMDGGAEDA